MLKRHIAGDFGFLFADFTVSLLIAIFLLILLPFILFFVADGCH